MAIKAEHISYIYNRGSVMEQYALRDVSFEIGAGEFVGVIGRTGSGKSTLIQHLDGLLKATEGKIRYNGEDIYAKDFNMKKLRREVGLVFQYPEYQLFEADILTDVMYGPKNLGLDKAEARVRAAEALRLVGIPGELLEKSPFELSGGQKRRVAIAGVLAMKPEILVLDEPTAGLDPQGRDDILGKIEEIHRQTGMSVVLVSHSMEDIARYVKRLMVVHEGRLVFDAPPREVFRHYKELEEMGLSAPQMTYVVQRLNAAGAGLPEDLITIEEVRDALLARLKR